MTEAHVPSRPWSSRLSRQVIARRHRRLWPGRTPPGATSSRFHNPNTCGETESGITQSWNASRICFDNGTSTGFGKGCSGAPMDYWEADDLPFYHSMARLYPIGTRYFSSVMAATYPNRRFLIAGTALGLASAKV